MKNKGFGWMREEGSHRVDEGGRVGWTTVKIRVDEEVRREGHHHRATTDPRRGMDHLTRRISAKELWKGFKERRQI
jgi:hypothetical protein